MMTSPTTNPAPNRSTLSSLLSLNSLRILLPVVILLVMMRDSHRFVAYVQQQQEEQQQPKSQTNHASATSKDAVGATAASDATTTEDQRSLSDSTTTAPTSSPSTSSPTSPPPTSLPLPYETRDRMRQSATAMRQSFPSLYQPVDCRAFLEEHVGDPEYDPNLGQIYARRITATTHPYFVSLHNFEFDHARQSIFDDGIYYETDQTRAFEEVLAEAPPNSRIVDVGGNIGWFTLLSLSWGFHVDTFEPNPKNLFRFCQALKFNEWLDAASFDAAVDERQPAGNNTSPQEHRPTSHVRALGVGNALGNLTLRVKTQNPGSGSFTDERKSLRGFDSVRHVPIVTLDDMAQQLGWLDDVQRPNFAVGLLKIDVEGFEPRVVEGARTLLKSGKVHNVFMEITRPNSNHSKAVLFHMLETLWDAGLEIYKVGYPRGAKDPPPYGLYEFTTFKDHAKSEYITKELLGPYIQNNLWWKRKDHFTPLRKRRRRGRKTTTDTENPTAAATTAATTTGTAAAMPMTPSEEANTATLTKHIRIPTNLPHNEPRRRGTRMIHVNHGQVGGEITTRGSVEENDHTSSNLSWLSS